MDLNHDDVLDVALSASLEAGELLSSFSTKLAERPTFASDATWTKSSGRDLATEADVAAERAIVARLRDAFPDHAIEAEEEVVDDGARREGARWFLDPLDGTINFVHNLPVWCVSMALFVEGVPEVAVIHAPKLGETFHAIRGRGAFLNGQRIHISPVTELSDCVLATGFPYRRGELGNDNRGNFNDLFYDIRGIRRMGSAAIDLAYTAAGRLDGYWELHLKSHDVAAGALLVREAGGIVTDVDGGEAWLDGVSILAAPEPIHRVLLPRLQGPE